MLKSNLRINNWGVFYFGVIMGYSLGFNYEFQEGKNGVYLDFLIRVFLEFGVNFYVREELGYLEYMNIQRGDGFFYLYSG